MNDHLPECYQSEGKWGGGCICIRLLACEKRIWRDPILVVAQKNGYAEALIDAQEALASMVIETVGNSAATVNQAIAAIDALRENND